MKKPLLYFFSFSLFFAACGGANKPVSDNKDSLPTNTIPVPDKNIRLATDKQQLIGKWSFGHEPFMMEFKADGTYLEYALLNEENGQIDPSQPSTQGTWSFANGEVTTKIKDENGALIDGYTNAPVYTMGSDHIFLTDFETEYESSGEEAGTREEFFKEFGYTRQ